MTGDVSACTQVRLDRLLRHAAAVIARRRRGGEEAKTRQEAERREHSLRRFIEQVERESDGLRDRLRRQHKHTTLLEARAHAKRPPRRQFKKDFRGPMR